MNSSVIQLRRQLEALAPNHHHRAHGHVALGVPAIDTHLKGGLGLGLLHEVYAAKVADMAATSGFTAGLVQRMAPNTQAQRARPVVWIRQTMSESEMGRLYPHGLANIGFDPARLISVRVNKAAHLLSAALEATRCASLAAVLIEAWGEPKDLDLTATRRLALAAEHSGTTPLLLRAAAKEQSSAAFTRWQVQAAPSQALAANAPGHPAFNLTLLRNKAGTHGQSWRVEWHHDLSQFRPIDQTNSLSQTAKRQLETRHPDKPTRGKPVLGTMVPLSARQSAATAERRTGTG
jgi:protein ImuA